MVNRYLVVFLLGAVLASGTVWACGPFFPQAYFAFGAESDIVHMPEASFRYQLYRLLNIAPLADEESAEYAPEVSPSERTLDVDAADFAEALRYANVPEQEAADRAAAYRAARVALPAFTWLDSGYEESAPATLESNERLELEAAIRQTLDGAPREFDLYAEGAARFRGGYVDGAISVWQELLALPPEDRAYRSTWAAYMIGRALMTDDPAAAIPYFEQTRELAKGNFRDSLSLAGESLGMQAYAERATGDMVAAIHHYAEQMALTDPALRKSAEISLRSMCSSAVDTRDTLVAIAADEQARRIMTAWIVSHPSSVEAAKLWIEVAAASGSADAFPDADLLAWTAYDLGDYAGATAWLAKPSAKTPYGDWVRSKTLLRDGKIEDAVELLRELAKTFPQTTEWTLFPGYEEFDTNTDPRKAVQAELGVLLLGRSEYVDAFDLLLRAGYWLDAAYIAERVLSEDELRAYVDAHSSDPELSNAVNVGYWYEGTVVQHLRYTLARRLARAGKWTDAISYLPPEQQQYANAFAAEMDKVPADAEPFLKPNLWEWFIGAKPERDVNREYAQHLFAAAEIARENGMELLGTEVEPDWHVFDGNFELPGAEANRLSAAPVHASDVETEPDEPVEPPLNAALARVLTASKDERARAQNHAPNPNRRYHYRYVAAELMWQSAQWLPNNDIDTMRALYAGGMYVQGRDPVAANKFYRALVWRNLNMAFAQQADRLRWFPPSFPE